LHYYASAPYDGGIKQCFCLTSVCLTSVAHIGRKSRTDRPRETKIGTEVAHVTRDSDTAFKVKGGVENAGPENAGPNVDNAGPEN